MSDQDIYENKNENDTNPLIILPNKKSVGERETQNEQPKMSSKKRKRMEKFIDKQLKKQEKIAVLEKLKIQQAEFDSLRPKLASSGLLKRIKQSSQAPTADTTEPLKQSSLRVLVYRQEKAALERAGLPILAHEQEIVEAIVDNPVVMLCGATGSGKTTQVPQFLYEHGFANPIHPKFPGQIAVTQPRRVAAASVAKRVAYELNVKLGREVGYHVRYDNQSRSNLVTKLKFMTDGILLREIAAASANPDALQLDRNCTESDFLLTKYSVIVIDEAHERTVGIDLLIGFLLRIAKLRNSGSFPHLKPLRIVIMSATLRIDDFLNNSKLFPDIKPPVLKIDGRQYRVAIHYNRKTPHMSYVDEAFHKVCRIHRTAGPGAILVFLTGAVEIRSLINMLSTEFNTGSTNADTKKKLFADDFSEDSEDSEEDSVHYLEGEIDEDTSTLSSAVAPKKLALLPLYSSLTSDDQMRVFEPVADGERLVVVATNIAETSLTIAGVRYVVDAGKAKSKKYDLTTGVEQFEIGWTSKASADQRAGRAGRTGMGHCYRLYSSEVFDSQFSQFSEPEICTTPVEGVVLQLKSMNITNVASFPFPTCPPARALKSAEQLLRQLGALGTDSVTPLGRLMVRLPLAPRFAKVLILSVLKAVLSKSSRLLAYSVALISGLSVGELQDDDSVPFRDSDYRPTSDLLQMVRLILCFERAACVEDSETVIAKFQVKQKAMSEVRKLRKQLTENLQGLIECESEWTSLQAQYQCGEFSDLKRLLQEEFYMDPEMDPPSESDSKLLLQLVASCFSDRIARLTPSSEFRDVKTGSLNASVEQWRRSSGKLPPLFRVMSGDATGVDPSTPVCIHASSCLYKQRPAPTWVMFMELSNSTKFAVPVGTGIERSDKGKLWIKKVSVIDPLWFK